MERKVEITNEQIQERVDSGKQYCLRIYKAGPNRNQPPAEAEEIQIEHLRYLFQLRLEGKLLINGPVLDDPVLKGISIFNTTDPEEKTFGRRPSRQSGTAGVRNLSLVWNPGECLPE